MLPKKRPLEGSAKEITRRACCKTSALPERLRIGSSPGSSGSSGERRGFAIIAREDKTMTVRRHIGFRCMVLALSLVALDYEAAQAQKKNPYTCKETDPASLCNAGNTCGSPSKPCSVDVKRTANSASATPDMPGAKGNSTFCVKVGTSVIWHSDTKHQGFVVDMGPNSPFDPPDDIVGGSAKDVTVMARTPGCYRFSAGACLSAAIYGMCGNGSAELVIVK